MTYVTLPSGRFHHRPRAADRLHAFAILYNDVYDMQAYTPYFGARSHPLQPTTRI